MATWITHLIVADKLLSHYSFLDKRGFCVGNIAPDCNVENADWTAFTPSREVTHWMRGERKTASDCDDFCEKYILKREKMIRSKEEYSFLLGYYSHLITDAAFQSFIRDDERVKESWRRLKSNPILSAKASGYPEDWDSLKKIIPKKERMHEIYSMEAEYLQNHPNSGYLTEILPLKDFPDYVDYLPPGSIARKINVMGYLPEVDEYLVNPISLSRDEFDFFTNNAAKSVIDKLSKLNLLK